jgi:hypothetical protein
MLVIVPVVMGVRRSRMPEPLFRVRTRQRGFVRAKADQLRWRRLSFDDMQNFTSPVECAHARFQRRHVGCCNQISLGDDDAVGERDLFGGFELFVDLLGAELRIHCRHNAVELIDAERVLIRHQGVCDRRGVSEAGGFQHHPLNRRNVAMQVLAVQLGQRFCQIATRRAAHTT